MTDQVSWRPTKPIADMSLEEANAALSRVRAVINDPRCPVSSTITKSHTDNPLDGVRYSVSERDQLFQTSVELRQRSMDLQSIEEQEVVDAERVLREKKVNV